MENRINPRYRVYLQVELDGLELTATNIGIELTANNISAYGMQISCPAFLIGRIQGLLDQDSFAFKIRLPGNESPCISNAMAVYDSEVGEEHLIGLKLINLEEHEKLKIDAYLQDLADRNAPVVN
jgi:uncharacterized protein YgfB (UPF0149 family)